MHARSFRWLLLVLTHAFNSANASPYAPSPSPFSAATPTKTSSSWFSFFSPRRNEPKKVSEVEKIDDKENDNKSEISPEQPGWSEANTNGHNNHDEDNGNYHPDHIDNDSDGNEIESSISGESDNDDDMTLLQTNNEGLDDKSNFSFENESNADGRNFVKNANNPTTFEIHGPDETKGSSRIAASNANLNTDKKIAGNEAQSRKKIDGVTMMKYNDRLTPDSQRSADIHRSKKYAEDSPQASHQQQQMASPLSDVFEKQSSSSPKPPQAMNEGRVSESYAKPAKNLFSKDRNSNQQQQQQSQMSKTLPDEMRKSKVSNFPLPQSDSQSYLHDETSDDDLEYTLPDLPIYNSDHEGESENEESYEQFTSNDIHAVDYEPMEQEITHSKSIGSSNNGTIPQMYAQQPTANFPSHVQQYGPDGDTVQVPFDITANSPYSRHPPNTYTEQQQHLPYQQMFPSPFVAVYPPFQFQTQQYQQPYLFPPFLYPYSYPQYGPISLQQANSGYAGGGQSQNFRPYSAVGPQSQSYFPPTQDFVAGKDYYNAHNGATRLQYAGPRPLILESPGLHTKASSAVKPRVHANASLRLTLKSMQKIGFMLLIALLACYAGVSPRTLPLTEYNLQFYENVCRVSLSAIAPLITILSVYNMRENDINSFVNTFFTSFTVGYIFAFGAEILMTTFVRLGVFYWLERDIFSLTPRIPLPVLPWVLRDEQYRPKRITLFVADFLTSCVVCPIIEEYLKLKLLQSSCDLPGNFIFKFRQSKRGKRTRRVAEAIARGPSEVDIINGNRYVTQMLAASIGLKLCDVGRRILLYTKAHNANKNFYAFCRGIFPIHELCGTLTALNLAKRDLLGVSMPLWKLIGPAVVIHGMANFRGRKPIFKWNSATPWSEMQLLPLNVPDASTIPILLRKCFTKLLWLIILSRVLGYCIKNYYMINRLAVKRTTTYAGKHAAFSAEIATTEVLKKRKKK